MEEKHCTACDTTKPIEDFYKDSTTVTGIGHYCKRCKRAMALKIYDARPRLEPAVVGARRCWRCKQTKPLTAFGVSRKKPEGRDDKCRACVKEVVAENKVNRPGCSNAAWNAWRALNPGRMEDYALKRNYGIPFNTYARMNEAQGGKCAICKSTEPGRRGVKRFAVDHCHETKEVRGLLCMSCNTGIGKFFHDPDLLSSAIAYLKNRCVIRSLE